MINETQDLTFASISHELRTPLNGIVGLTDSMLQLSSCPAAVKKMLGVVRAQGIRLNGLVNDILDAASNKRGKLVLKIGQVDLWQITESV
jgi:two-component system sensor histidine kinase ChiS